MPVLCPTAGSEPYALVRRLQAPPSYDGLKVPRLIAHHGGSFHCVGEVHTKKASVAYNHRVLLSFGYARKVKSVRHRLARLDQCQTLLIKWFTMAKKPFP